MAEGITGSVIYNRVKWEENVASRRRSFKSVTRYKKLVTGLQSQLAGIGKIKLQLVNLREIRAQLLSLGISPTSGGGNRGGGGGGSGREILSVGPPVPPPQGKDVAAAAKAKEDLKAAKAEEKRLNEWLAEANKKALLEEKTIRNGIAAKERQRAQEAVAANARAQAAAKEILNKKRLEERLEDRIADFKRSKQYNSASAVRQQELITAMKLLRTDRALKNEIKQRKFELQNELNLRNANLRAARQLNFAQRRGLSSVQQMAGGMFSIYTAFQGVGAIARTGVEMQKVAATMLSVSASSEEAKDNMTFLRGEAKRLGMDRVKAGRAFSKILAARGELSIDDSKLLFTGVSEAGVVSGTSADEMSLQVKALSQMLG